MKLARLIAGLLAFFAHVTAAVVFFVTAATGAELDDFSIAVWLGVLSLHAATTLLREEIGP